MNPFRIRPQLSFTIFWLFKNASLHRQIHKTESAIEFTRYLGEGKMEFTFNGHRVSVWVKQKHCDENILETVVTVAQCYECN